jgi:tetratricopeptide (TPR) repeat protein
MRLNLIFRVLVAVIGLFLCYRLAVGSLKSGYARLFNTAAIISSTIEPCDAAIAASPADPEAHYTRGLTLVNLQRLDEAVSELKTSTQLRPRNYYEWLDLGVTQDRLGDSLSAETSLKQSISLAPTFAQPHWQLGNVLYREGRYSEAFDELRRGSRSNPDLTESLMRLAWPVADNDTPTFLAFVQPNYSKDHLVAARYLASLGKGADATEQVRQAGPASDDEDRGYIKQSIYSLLTLQQYPEALNIWRLAHPEAANAEAGQMIINAKFLNPLVRDDPGFGWQLPSVENLSVAVDRAGASAGSRSLLLEFRGQVPSGTPLVSQLVLLQPGTRYGLKVMTKTDNLVSGGPVTIVILSADPSGAKLLAQSAAIAVGSTDWTPINLQFSTSEQSAVTLVLQRQACNETPCPIFGNLWLSDFSLTRL